MKIIDRMANECYYIMLVMANQENKGKVFCNTDRIMYSGLIRHGNFVRHYDLSDWDAYPAFTLLRGAGGIPQVYFDRFFYRLLSS